MTRPADKPTDRLARRLGTADAVVIGLGSMVGAGVFAAFQPAAEAAGSALLVGLALAGLVAYANATSSAQLAALYPASGGTYVYGRARLGHLWGYLAGWGFVVGKTASCAAMALTFGAAVAPGAPRVAGAAAVVALVTLNVAGVRKTALATRVLLILVLSALALVVTAAVGGGAADPRRLALELGDLGGAGVLQSAGLLFFAFAGYARIATLGEEVRDPAVTIPRAIPLALFIALALYAAVASAILAVLGADGVAASAAPLVAAVEATDLSALAPLVRAGQAVASLAVLLSLLAGVGRTTFAMASEGDLPRVLSAVSARARTPYRAEIAVGVVVVCLLLLVDLRGAIGFSSFAVLTYYAVANASALTLGPRERRWPKPIAALGLAGCLLLAFSLTPATVLSGLGVLAVGVAAWWATARRR